MDQLLDTLTTTPADGSVWCENDQLDQASTQSVSVALLSVKIAQLSSK
jgi:hypothetical protein